MTFFSLYFKLKNSNFEESQHTLLTCPLCLCLNSGRDIEKQWDIFIPILYICHTINSKIQSNNTDTKDKVEKGNKDKSLKTGGCKK
jgi:hypothetical protein